MMLPSTSLKNHDDPTAAGIDIDSDKAQTPPEHDILEEEKEHIDITDPITSSDFPDGGYGWSANHDTSLPSSLT
jgi:hypothetical protein